ncbi:MAG: hypothetical protein ACOYN0_17410 [Phycisphaerales bacterium]
MIRCNPRGLCSWDFLMDGDGGEHAELTFDWLGEGGTLDVNGTLLEVRKQGIFSGEWELSDRGERLASVRKWMLSWNFEITAPLGVYWLRRSSLFTRGMGLTGEGTDCVIEPEHAFTRRARITGEWANFPIVAFAFWLTVLMWRRKSRND